MSPFRAELRLTLLARRKAMSESEHATADACIRLALAAAIEKLGAAAGARPLVACYWPIAGEPDLRPLWPEWKQVALPVVVGRGMPLRFALWRPGTVMRAGPFGAAVPEVAQWVEPDLIVLPCLGFFVDQKGRCFRLGYGGGYYDRTLAAHTRPTLGVAYSESRLEEFPIAEHDVPLDAIITQSACF